ncbi:nucleotidyl transferase AbiEii/AbiGii toxin family protein [Bacteroidota bacterium]
MNLHDNENNFRALVDLTSEAFDLEPIYVEKDYFVVLALKGLSESIYKRNGIFKGGTALSKSYNAIDRFSEDIDLVVMNDAGDAPGSRTMMKNIETALTSNPIFTRINNHPREKKGTRLRQTAYK